MTDDIVKRLRLTPVLMYTDQLGQSRIDYEACKKYINNEGVKMMRDAADEIERLRRDYSCICNEMRRIMEERDEARWRLCKVVGDNRGVWGCEIAKENGWDYLATEAKP